MPLRVFWRRFGAAAAIVVSAVPAIASGQGRAGADSLAVPGIAIPAGLIPRFKLVAPGQLTPFGRAILRGDPSSIIARAQGAAFADSLRVRERQLWVQSNIAYRSRVVTVAGQPVARPALLDSLAMEKPDSGLTALLAGLLGEDSNLSVAMNATFETKVDRRRNERCTASEVFAFASQCSAGFQPDFDLTFSTLIRGTVAGRFFVNVDYDTKREFKSSDNINVYYQGKSDELLSRVEVGNVSFVLPPSQFITSGIPQGNFGVQALGQIGGVKFRTIVAQQQGNIPKNYEVLVGDKTVKAENTELEDYQIEARRFFFTVDPQKFGAAYPNIDILNGVQMRSIADGLPETVRPRRLFVYRLQFTGQPTNPNGPRFQLIDRPGASGQIYQLLQENNDYYTDPSLLWIALKTPLNIQNERLVVAYTLRIGGRDTVIAELGGTPDIAYVADRPQLAHLLWDPSLRPADAEFRNEIRSAYRIAGEDLNRTSVSVRVLTGGGAGQEKPLAGNFDTYLQMFGLAQSSNASLFDVENRLWPRPSDPNTAIGASANQKIISQFFMVLPSVRPFAQDGLVLAGNPVSDTIYVTPGEDLYSQQHPQSHYRIQLNYQVSGGGNVGMMSVGAVQLRRGSEVVTVDGVPLAREADYAIDYDIGEITFTRPDTLFRTPRRVSVRYEENPQFAAAPTSILGLALQAPLERGELGFTMISQRQTTSFTRPPLGYEPQSSFIAGVNGNFNFEASGLSRLIEKLPTIESTTMSHVTLQGEFATSRPQPNSAGQAFVETFENEGAIAIPVQDAAWYYSSQPALSNVLQQRYGGDNTFALTRASTMAWQGTGLTRAAGVPLQFNITQIDPQATLTSSGVVAPEPMLWLTLYPLATGGLRDNTTGRFQWTLDNAPQGRRWRSLRAGLGPSGADLSHTEYITFWTLIDTTFKNRAKNASLVIDLGDNSENSISFGPTQLELVQNATGGIDSLFTGKALMGFDELNSERDSLTRSFNQATNDKGLPGDLLPSLNVFRGENFEILENFSTCSKSTYQLLLIGDSRANCTVGNGRLDEEDVDFDNVLNFTNVQRSSERVRRYVVDLANPASISRMGKCSVAAFDTTAGGTVTATDLCWALVRIPFGAPDDSLNGGPNVRRVRSIRVTLVSGEATEDTSMTILPLARFRFEGSPLIKRSSHTVHGIAGDQPSQGFTIASVIGTQDRDSLRGVDYQPPPGVTDEPEHQQTGLENQQTQINERSLRLLSGHLDQYDRAEAFLRFPEGAKNFMSYGSLKVWARGRGDGWGHDGELQFFIKIGKDANNFYLYRTDISAGLGRDAWMPEVRVDFNKLFELQTALRNSVFGTTTDSIACTGADSILIANSGIPIGQPVNRHAVCSDGYMVYSVDPAVNPPSLTQVQELAVGMVRMKSGGGGTPIMLADTLELWVDDIRLDNVEKTPGYAAQMALNVQAGDVANFRFNVIRRDAHFRQLAELPSFLGTDGFNMATSLRLERLLPGMAGFAVPLVISYTTGSSSPLFLSQSDVLAGGIQNLRTPHNSATSYNMSIRRIAPVTNSRWAVLVNNLSLNANLLKGQNQSEFSEGGSSSWNMNADYNLQANPKYHVLPRWLRIGTGDDTRFRWNPSILSFGTDIARTSDSRLSFSKPVMIASDTGRRVEGQSYVMRTRATVELRPVTPLSMQWNFTSTRDLRNYGDTSATAILASNEREKLLGMNLGMERERFLNSQVQFAPAIASFFRPSVRYASSYAMQRDPQSRQIVREFDSTGAFLLPSRLNNSQTFGASAQFEPERALKLLLGQTGKRERFANVFQALDINYGRTLVSAYDAAPFFGGLGYQYGLGGLDAFLRTNDRLATIAGESNTLTITNGFRLPAGIQLTNRVELTTADNYTKRLNNTQALIHGAQQTLPDLDARWTDTLAWLKNIRMFGTHYPFAFMHVVQNVGLNVHYTKIRQLTFAPAENAGERGDRRTGISQRIPLTATISWRDPGGLITTFGFTKQQRTDSVVGSVTQSKTSDFMADAGRGFKLPRSWHAISRLRTHLSWTASAATSYISVANSQKPSRLADNGVRRISLQADTDIASNVKFQLQGSRIVTFDNNYNRKFSQLVLNVLFTLQYTAGGGDR